MTFWQRVFQFQKEKIAPWIALRNTVGFALPLILGAAIGQIAPAIIAVVGALNVSYSDSYDPYIQRARRMLAASGLVAAAVILGSICADHHLLAIPVAGGWAFAVGMLVALGTTAADLGNISLVTLVVFAAKPLPPEAAALSGSLALGGALFQTALALIFWPIRRYAPERHALASLYGELARVAAAPIQVYEAPPASTQSVQAQAALASLSDHSIDGERYRMLLSQAERTRLGLFGLGRLRVRIARTNPQCGEAALLEDYLHAAAGAMESIAAELERNQPAGAASPELQRLDALADQARAQCRNQEAAVTGMLNDARAQMDAVTGQLRAAMELAVSASAAGLKDYTRQEFERPARLRLTGTLAILRANLSLRSAACRHAIRLAVCVALAETLAAAFRLDRPYWLPMTAAIVLKPDFASTFSRGLLRLAGTFIGLILATALFHLLAPGLFVQIAAMAALMFVLRCWGPANYGIFVIATTGMVVLLIAVAGVSPQAVIAARGLNTALGGAIALAAYWLWPTWERARVEDAMAQLLDAYRAYFEAIRECYSHPEELMDGSLDGARLESRRARSNLEASFDRWRVEPGTDALILTDFSGMLASSHRFIHAVMALEAGFEASRPAPARDAFRRFADDVETTLVLLSAGLRGRPLGREELPDLREDHYKLLHIGDPATERYALVNVETDRVTNSLNTLSEQLLAWQAARGQAHLG